MPSHTAERSSPLDGIGGCHVSRGNCVRPETIRPDDTGEGLTVPDRHGPLRQYRYLLEIEGVAIAGFSQCLLPTSRTATIEYREGNDPPKPRKLSGLNDYGPLVLEKGVTAESTELAEWRTLVVQGKTDEARRPVAVVLLDTEGNPSARWEFENAWPSAYEGPRLSATRDGVAIERLVVVNEGFERVE